VGALPGFCGSGTLVFTGPGDGCTDVFGSTAVTFGGGVGLLLGVCVAVRVGATGLTTAEVTGVT
jgi:hypothetical protein